MGDGAAAETFEQWPAPSWAKYDWDKILDGNRNLLRKGVHFECSAVRMRQNVHTGAARKGISVRTAISGDSLYVEAYGTRRVSRW